VSQLVLEFAGAGTGTGIGATGGAELALIGDMDDIAEVGGDDDGALLATPLLAPPLGNASVELLGNVLFIAVPVRLFSPDFPSASSEKCPPTTGLATKKIAGETGKEPSSIVS